MDSKPYIERKGSVPRRSNSFLFLLVIGGLVAGAGIAGLHYAEPYFGTRPVSADQNAPTGPTTPEFHADYVSTDPIPAPVFLTGADTTGDAGAGVVKAEPKKDEEPKANKTPPRPPSHSHHASPTKAADKPAEDPFAKPD